MKTPLALILSLLILSCQTVPGTTVPYGLRSPQMNDFPFAYLPGQVLGWDAGAKIAVLRLNVQFTEDSASQALNALSIITLSRPDYLVIELDSVGGNLGASNRIANTLVQLPIPVICVVKNLAASAAFILLQSCDVRYAEPGSFLMMHEASLVTDNVLDQFFMADNIKRINVAVSNVVCRRLTITYEQCVEQYRGRDWWMTADEAKLLGAIDEVADEKDVVDMLRFFGQVEPQVVTP